MAYVLEGLKVIDAASYVAGPAAATVMADFGADVIKVEPPQGDGYRTLAARYRTDYNWLLTSRNKRDLGLDISTDGGQRVLQDLIDTADVLLVNFNSEQIKRFNLEYETLKARNPRLIYAHITGYGTKGADSMRRAFDVAAWWARSGILDLMKPFGGPPTGAAGGVGDHATAMSLFGAIMLALYTRERTGAGSYVETSLLANGAWSNGMQLQGVIAGFDIAALLEERYNPSPFVLSYLTADDRYVMLVGPDPKREWPRVCRALGREEWTKDPRYPDISAVLKQRPEVREMFAEAIRAMPLAEIVAALNREGVTYSVVEKIGNFVRDEQVLANDVVVKTESSHPDYQWTVNSPIAMAGAAKRPPREAPAIGAHSREILAELGLSEAQISRLIEAGAVVDGQPD